MSDILDELQDILKEDSRDYYAELVLTLMEIMPSDTITFAGIKVNIKDRLIDHMNDNRLEVIKLLNIHGDKLIECIKNVKIK